MSRLHPEMSRVIRDSDSKNKESVKKLGTCASVRKGSGYAGLGTGDVAEYLTVNAFDDFRRDNPIRIFFEIIGG